MSKCIGNPPDDRENEVIWLDRVEQAVRSVSSEPVEATTAGVVKWPCQRPGQSSTGQGRAENQNAGEKPSQITGAHSCVRLLIPGSFNPLHQGHLKMAEYASRRLGQAAWFELSLANADKPKIDDREVIRRLLPSLIVGQIDVPGGSRSPSKSGDRPGHLLAELEQNCQEKILKKRTPKLDSTPATAQFIGDEAKFPTLPSPASFRQHGVLLTSAATYVEKARLFPGCTFALGVDTILRVADVRFYSGEQERLEIAIDELRELQCRFMVFGRTLSGKFRSMNDLLLPHSLRGLCDEIPVQDFRHDVSSSELRKPD